MRSPILLLTTWCSLAAVCRSQELTQLGQLREVFAWKQLTYNINGQQILRDRSGSVDDDGDGDEDRRSERERRQVEGGQLVFTNRDEPERQWEQNSFSQSGRPNSQSQSSWGNGFSQSGRPNSQSQSSWGTNNNPSITSRPSQQRTSSTTRRPRRPTTSSTTASPEVQSGQFFIQYNNLPMGVERVGNRLFVTVPRRRYGVPSTLNYLDLTEDSHTRSPGLRPYPNLRLSRNLTSVYRTRADHCNRLWMVDTGLLEIPNNRQQVQQPAVVIYDLTTNRQTLRYPFKSSDLVSATTPTGLASITLDFVDEDCSRSDVFAYIPDLATYGLIVFSLRQRDSWRLEHNYFHFNPLAGNLRIAGQSFQWSDGIFSLTLTPPRADGCRTAYFHAMVGTSEFSVSSCVLRNNTAASSDTFWSQFQVEGDRGSRGQSTMHGYHAASSVLFYADIGRDAISCWNTGTKLSPANIGILAQDSLRISYPSDLHVTGDEVWVMANSLPTWAYSRLDTNQYNFFIYRANVQDLIARTVCSGSRTSIPDLGSRTAASLDEDKQAV